LIHSNALRKDSVLTYCDFLYVNTMEEAICLISC